MWRAGQPWGQGPATLLCHASLLCSKPFLAAGIRGAGNIPKCPLRRLLTHVCGSLEKGVLGNPKRTSGCADSLRIPGFPEVCVAPNSFSAPDLCLALPLVSGRPPGEPTSIQTGGAGGTPRGPLRPRASCPGSPLFQSQIPCSSLCVCGQVPRPLCFQVLPCRQPRAPEDRRTGGQEDGRRMHSGMGTCQARGWNRGCVLGFFLLAALPADSSAHALGRLPHPGPSPWLPWKEESRKPGSHTRLAALPPPGGSLPAPGRGASAQGLGVLPLGFSGPAPLLTLAEPVDRRALRHLGGLATTVPPVSLCESLPV